MKEDYKETFVSA